MAKWWKKVTGIVLVLLTLLLAAGCYYLPEAYPSPSIAPKPSATEKPSREPSPSTSPSPSPSKNTANVTPALYTVTGKNGKGTLYLFGSIHVGDESMYPLPDAVMQAYDNSDALAVEYDILADMDDDAMEAYYEAIIYSRGKTIESEIGAELYEAAVSILQENGLYNIAYDYYKPILWNDLFSLIASEEAGLSSEYGIDRHFLQMAYLEDKEILEVESMQMQLEMMLNFPDRLQVLMLNDNVEDYEDAGEGLTETFENWKSGTIDEMAGSSIYVPPKYVDFTKSEVEELYTEYYEAMITKRNEGMAEKAMAYLSENKTVFFVVGEGHMGGEGGIVQLLKAAGYTVQRVSY